MVYKTMGLSVAAIIVILILVALCSCWLSHSRKKKKKKRVDIMNSHKKQAEEEKSVSFQDHEDFYIRTSENMKTMPSERRKKVDALPNTS